MNDEDDLATTAMEALARIHLRAAQGIYALLLAHVATLLRECARPVGNLLLAKTHC